VLVGEDSALGREVWVVLRPRASPPPDPARRALTRPTRNRWLSGGDQPEGRWDAFVPPSGCPLADLAGRDGLPWHEARPILHDLAGELVASCADGTLPETLSVDQVWVQPDGSAQLVDVLAAVAPAGGTVAQAPDRALGLLREAAALALEGGRRRPGTTPTAIRAVVPGHAVVMLDRLCGGDNRYDDVAAFLRDLDANRDLPTEVGVGPRGAQLALSAALLLPGILLFSYSSWTAENLTPGVTAKVVAWPVVWVIWAFLTEGGFASRLAGLTTVRSDGRPAGPLRCAGRSALLWGPVSALLLLSVWVRSLGWSWSGGALWGLTLLALVVSPLLTLLQPARSPLDRLAGTHQVPL
jgi:hypothetical protein